MYMKTWNYNRTDTMPISYTIIMIKSAGAKFPPEYSDRNLIVKTQFVKEMWLSGSCRTSPVQDRTHMANPVITATASATHTVVAVFLYVLLLLYLSLSLSLILIPQNLAYCLTFPLDT